MKDQVDARKNEAMCAIARLEGRADAILATEYREEVRTMWQNVQKDIHNIKEYLKVENFDDVSGKYVPVMGWVLDANRANTSQRHRMEHVHEPGFLRKNHEPYTGAMYTTGDSTPTNSVITSSGGSSGVSHGITTAFAVEQNGKPAALYTISPTTGRVDTGHMYTYDMKEHVVYNKCYDGKQRPYGKVVFDENGPTTRMRPALNPQVEDVQTIFDNECFSIEIPCEVKNFLCYAERVNLFEEKDAEDAQEEGENG